MSPNDAQSTPLARCNNSYEEDNYICCFNHTIHLSAKTLLAPLNPALSSSVPLDSTEEIDIGTDEIPELEGVSDEEDKGEEEACGSDSEDADNQDDNNDFTKLTEECE